MFYRKVAFITESNDLFVYKLPDTLTDEQINWLFNDYYKIKGRWFGVNDVKVHRELSRVKYRTLFISDETYRNVVKIKEYFDKYDSKDAIWIQMKALACRYLFKRNLVLRDITNLLGYKNHTSINYMLTKYKLFDSSIDVSDFMGIVERQEYPKTIKGKTIFFKL